MKVKRLQTYNIAADNFIFAATKVKKVHKKCTSAIKHRNAKSLHYMLHPFYYLSRPVLLRFCVGEKSKLNYQITSDLFINDSHVNRSLTNYRWELNWKWTIILYCNKVYSLKKSLVMSAVARSYISPTSLSTENDLNSTSSFSKQVVRIIRRDFREYFVIIVTVIYPLYEKSINNLLIT